MPVHQQWNEMSQSCSHWELVKTFANLQRLIPTNTTRPAAVLLLTLLSELMKICCLHKVFFIATSTAGSGQPRERGLRGGKVSALAKCTARVKLIATVLWPGLHLEGEGALQGGPSTCGHGAVSNTWRESESFTLPTSRRLTYLLLLLLRKYPTITDDTASPASRASSKLRESCRMAENTYLVSTSKV